MQQVLEKISRDEMEAIAAACDRKAARFGELLAPGPLDDEGARALLGMMFGARRQADAILASLGSGGFGRAAADLVGGTGSISERFDAFAGSLQGYEDRGSDIAGELLHWSDPDRYWLWTKWMWDPRTETGSLRLVTMEEVDLYGATPGETYLKVGQAVAFVNETGRAVGFTAIGNERFGINVFLACAYGIYMYTVLRMRMTQEFNQIVPALPELARRLLGVYRLEA